MPARHLAGNIRPETLARFAMPVTVLLAIVVARGLADLSWTLISGPSPSSQDPAQALQQAQPMANAEIADYSAIPGWHLFGRANLIQPTPKPTAKAPETRLNLQLMGVFHAENSGKALAIIADKGNDESIYKVGDELAPGVSLVEIRRNQIVLSRKGKFEALSLPKESSPLAAPVPAAYSKQGSASIQQIDASGIAGRLRGALRERPRDLQDLAFISPYIKDNQFRGFSLRPGRNPKLLEQLGLRGGDVIISVNGTTLMNPPQAAALMADMLAQDQVDVVVLRKGEELPFTFTLNGQ